MSNIYNISLSNNKNKVIEYITEQKQKGEFRVIDVGASQDSWSASVVDATVDFMPSILDGKIKRYSFDITDYEAWREIEQDIEKNGKYDFSICSHTLEDIINPKMVVKKLAIISKAGFISTPSKYKEFSRNLEGFEGISSPYRGYIHHRWIFTFKNNIYTAYPKVNFVDYINIGDKIGKENKNQFSDLNFFWDTNVNLEYINNNYLGPSVSAVVNYYNELLSDDCEKIINIL
jgi:hypothetical protein